jgi:hypothetical protein
VTYESFQDGVRELAAGGTRLTKATVAARLSMMPESAGEMLDRMARDGELELDVDERSGEIYFQPATTRRAARGATPAAPAKKSGGGLAVLRDAETALEQTLERGKLAAKVGSAIMLADKAGVPAERRRKVALGVLLGGLFPGIGLAYAAPWPVAAVASVVVIVGVKVLAFIPIVSTFLLVPFVVVCVLASAVLGGLYTWSYNQAGKRAPLGDEPVSPKALLKRLGK